MMNNKYFKIIIAIVVFILVSCDYELDKVNPNNVNVDLYFTNATELENTVNGVYAVLQAHQLFAREWFFIHDMRGDDMASGGGHLESPRAQLLAGSHNPANYVINEVWKGCYGIVHRSNIAIQKAAGIDMDANLKSRLVAEAKFLQAWAYLELVTIWGGVPIYEEFVTAPDQGKPRATAEEVYNKVNTLLTEAIADLPVVAPVNGRVTKGAAKALLARAYLHQGNYAVAKPHLLELTTSPYNYRLTDSYNDSFLEETEYNIESLFEVGFRPSNNNTGWGTQLGDGLNQETTLRNQEYSAISWRNAIPSNSLLEEFEHVSKGDPKNDPRFEYTFYQIGDVYNSGNNILVAADVRGGNNSILRGQEAIINWRKHTLMYKTNATYNPSGLNERVIRYADVLLMLAECQNETDEPEAVVLNTLNQVRRRTDVQMPDYPTTNWPTATKEQRRKAIIHERRVELAGEAIRDMDIARWRKNGKLEGEPLSYFVPNKHELLPIPQTEIDNNPAINISDQNPGY